VSNARTVHFHDGPHHGKTADLRPDVDMIETGDGAYVRDPASAGGRCMSWEPDYPFQEITAPPLPDDSSAITKGSANVS
jgi:hypothetical protein